MRALALLVLVACAPEPNVDDTRIRGRVSVADLGGEPQGMTIGAYLPGEDGTVDPRRHGDPVGGAGVFAWTLDAGTWYGRYEIYVVQSVGPIRDAEDPESLLDLDVDVALDEVFLLAMDSGNLNQPFTGGVRYSGTPVRVDLTGEPERRRYTDAPFAAPYWYYSADDLVIDSFVEAGVGFTFDEVEPNDVTASPEPPAVDPGSYANCNDLGVLSGFGQTDTINGAIVLGDGEGFQFHENDCFHFQVSDDALLSFTLTYDDAQADALDAVLWVADGSYVDYADASPGLNPVSNANGFQTRFAGEDYYMIVFGDSGPAGNTSSYTVEIEMLAP